MLKSQQERELDKVNAFYLQKEAEVRRYSSPLFVTVKFDT
jgi:hypothetical protein